MVLTGVNTLRCGAAQVWAHGAWTHGAWNGRAGGALNVLASCLLQYHVGSRGVCSLIGSVHFPYKQLSNHGLDTT